MKRILAIGCVYMILLALPATPGAAQGQRLHVGKPAFAVGLVTGQTPADDGSLNQLVLMGVNQAVAKYGIKASVAHSRSSGDYVRDLTRLVRERAGLTIAAGPAMQKAIYTVAVRYPNRKFAIVDGTPTTPKGQAISLANVRSLHFAEQEAGFLVGVIAAAMEAGRAGRASHYMIGFMGGAPTPTVNRYLAGYIAAAERVAPGIRIVGGFSHSFTNQARGRAIALKQIHQGADILFEVAGASGLGYLAAAGEKRVYGIGGDSDRRSLGPYIITSALRNVPSAVSRTIGEAAAGHFVGGDSVFDVKNGGVGLAKPSPVVPRSVLKFVAAYKKAIAAGTVVPPATMPRH
jgi:basic membrane protein A